MSSSRNQAAWPWLLAFLLVSAGPLPVDAPAQAAAPPGGAAVPAFSGERALDLIRTQCELGPRTPGSPGNAALRRLIIHSAGEAGLRAVPLCFRVPLGEGGAMIEACNVVVSAGPPGGERLWLGAHFDTRPWADRDPQAARRTLPVVGANDGGSGTAVLLHLMELLGASPPPQGVDLIFFDAEDSGQAHDAAGFCLGSRHLVETRGDFGHPLSTGTPKGLVLLDMVGEAGARIPQEGYSLEYAPEWTAHVFARAAALGLPVFEAAPARSVFDDHVPFLGAGIPAVNLIDFEYPQWHTVDDTPDRCSSVTLGQVGRLVTDLVYRP